MGYIVSEDAKILIKSFESLKLKAYLCPAGKWTIGYGHTGKFAYDGLVISETIANQLLDQDIEYVINVLKPAIKNTELTANQFGAIVSLSFNVGPYAIKASSLIKKINSKDLLGAADEFLKWDKAKINGVIKTLSGLTKRRTEERKLFLKDVE